jgi:hypothetical protein
MLGHLSQNAKDNTDSDMERFVVLLYSQTGTVNAARRQLFSYTYGNRKLENIPLSRAALLQHIKLKHSKQVMFPGQALISSPALPSPFEWG